MKYAQLERRGDYGIVTAIADVQKTLEPPRYILIDGITPEPQVGWFYRNGTFTAIPPPAELRNALRDIIIVLENAGLVTRNF